MEVEFLGDASFGEKWQKAKLLAVGSLPATLGGLGAGGAFAKGLGAMVVRELVGVYEFLSAPIEVPEGFRPILKPEFPWDYFE